MATITIRDLDDDVRSRLRRRAAANNRSMEAEAREILRHAVIEEEFATAWVNAFRGRGVTELRLPARSAPRGIDLG